MSPLQIHLLFNHFPVILSLICIPVLLWAYRSSSKEVWQAAFAFSLLASITVAPAFFTGEGAEETLEDRPGISSHQIHEHEELAEKALWPMILLGVLSLWGLYSRSKKMIPFALFAAITSGVLLGLTAHEGGAIRRPELKAESIDAAQAPPTLIPEDEETVDAE